MRALIELLVQHDFLLIFISPRRCWPTSWATPSGSSPPQLRPPRAAPAVPRLALPRRLRPPERKPHRPLGRRSLLAAKFLPGISVVAAPMAGALGMGWRRFIAYDARSDPGRAGRAVQRRPDRPGRHRRAAADAGRQTLVAPPPDGSSAGEIERISVEDAASLIDQDMAPQFIDVRSDAGRAADPRTLPGALNIPLPRLAEYADQLPDDRLLVLYCNCPNEVSAITGAHQLLERGHARVLALEGGLDGWDARAAPPSAGSGRSRRRQRREGRDSRTDPADPAAPPPSVHPAVP
ncbi:rhodanese-like domain-containing protein [Ditylenchus destructor]|nr:rhodanese-like domain-containing protein [Ditylenchus destructor]